MKISGLFRVAVVSAVLGILFSGIVLTHGLVSQEEVSLLGITGPKWAFWSLGGALGIVAYIGAALWMLGEIRDARGRGADGSPGHLSAWDGLKGLLAAPLVIAASPLLVLSGILAGALNGEDKGSYYVREFVRGRWARKRRNPTSIAWANDKRLVEERERPCPGCGRSARYLPVAGAVLCKDCGMAHV